MPNIILLKRTARQVLTLVVCNSLRWYAELNHPEPKQEILVMASNPENSITLDLHTACKMAITFKT